jgi:AcrR family transcriptional regulator
MDDPPTTEPPKAGLGLRERKRRQTQQAIVDAALRLFLKRGYDETTLDEIAAEAGISRRTFFSYFSSKEEIFRAATDNGFMDALRTAFGAADTGRSPLEAVRRELPRLVSRFETKEAVNIDRLMRSTEALRARKLAIYVEMEDSLFEALRGSWCDEDEDSLRLVAMVSIGVLRLALDVWRKDGGKRPLATRVREGLGRLKSTA